MTQARQFEHDVKGHCADLVARWLAESPEFQRATESLDAELARARVVRHGRAARDTRRTSEPSVPIFPWVLVFPERGAQSLQLTTTEDGYGFSFDWTCRVKLRFFDRARDDLSYDEDAERFDGFVSRVVLSLVDRAKAEVDTDDADSAPADRDARLVAVEETDWFDPDIEAGDDRWFFCEYSFTFAGTRP